MGLLGDGWDDPRSSAMMALAGGLLKGDFGGGLLGANDAYTNARKAAMDQKFRDVQMQNYQSEIDQRRAAIAKQQQIQEMTQRLLANAGRSAPAQQGQMGSGTFGIMPTAAGVPDMPQPGPQGLGGASLEDIVALQAAGGPNLLDAYKLAREGFERKPGTFYERVGGGREYVPDPSKGFTYQGGQVGLLPGFAQTNAQITASSELPKAILQSAGRVNLRKNADGTESPVPELTENPLLGGMFGQMFGGATRPPVAAPMPAPGGMPQAAPGRPVVTPAAQRGADAEAIRLMQAELQNPNLPPADRAAITREIERMTQAQAMPGFPAASSVRLGQYGKTTAQETQEAVDKAKRLKQAEADVKPTEQRQNDIAGANYMLSVIDQAINHPGRATATGVSGTLDPRNYLPGTNAKDFQSLRDQIRGGTFMQAYQNLKGGGQITEVEGTKAENAIARLNTAQSDDAWLKAATELRQVISNGLERQKAGMKASNGATGSFAGDNSEMVKSGSLVPSLPKTAAKGTRARDTTTGEVLEFNGMSWVKAR